MSWNDVIAAAGGAAAGGNQAVQFYDKQHQQEELAQLRNIIQILGIRSREDIAAAANMSREGIAGAGNETRAGIATAGNASREGIAAAGNTSREGIAAAGVTSREGIADANRTAADERFWGGTMPLGWGRVDATIHGQDQASADRRYGVDVGAATSRSNADLGATVSQRNADLAAQTQRFGISRRPLNTFGASATGDPSLATMPDVGGVPRSPATGDTALPPAPVTRAPVPVAPRRAPIAPTMPPQGAAPPSTGPKTVTLAELQRVATLRGTTVDVQKQRAIAQGFTVLPIPDGAPGR